MSPSEAPSEIAYLNLRVGRGRPIPLCRPVANETALGAAIRKSESLKRFHLVEGTRFQVGVSDENERDGNFLFWIAAGVPLNDGRVDACETLFSGAVACKKATAPIAWRAIFQQYLIAMMGDRMEDRFHAPGPMPVRFPWVCTFHTSAFSKAGRENCVQTVGLAVSVALVLARRGLRAVALNPSEEGASMPNLDLFPELGDWED